MNEKNDSYNASLLITFLFMLVYRMHEPIIPRGARQGPSQLKRTCSIFAYEDIKEVHKRRYLLQVTWVQIIIWQVKAIHRDEIQV